MIKLRLFRKSSPKIFFIKLVTTFFYVGYLPLIPGTFASVVGLLLYAGLRERFNLLIPTHIVIMTLGFLFCGKAAKLFSRRDPPQVVIDEVNGIFLSFLGLSADRFILLAGFCIFRVFDALKPYPANRFQRRWGSIGIMGDDIIAAIYTNLLLRLILPFLP